MKSWIGILFFVLLNVVLLNGAAFADSDSSTTPVVRGTGHGHHAGVKISAKNAKNNSKTIQGNCETVASASNPVPGACVNLVLILKDAQGNDVVKNRTSANGHFEFPAEPGKVYTIASGSRYFEVVEAKNTTQAGSKIVVHLKLK